MSEKLKYLKFDLVPVKEGYIGDLLILEPVNKTEITREEYQALLKTQVGISVEALRDSNRKILIDGGCASYVVLLDKIVSYEINEHE